MYLFLHNLAATVINQTSVENCPNQTPNDPQRALDAGQNAELCNTALPKVSANIDTVQTVLQLLFAAIGAIALFFVIMGGLKFITSQGDPQGIGKARKTIIFAAIGLAVALSAEAIVTWVLGNV